MSKKFIDFPIENYRIEIRDDPFCYMIEKYTGSVENKDTKEMEEKWVTKTYHASLEQVVNSLSKILSLDKIEKNYIKDNACSLTIKQYLKLLCETEAEIRDLLGKVNKHDVE